MKTIAEDIGQPHPGRDRDRRYNRYPTLGSVMDVQYFRRLFLQRRILGGTRLVNRR